MFLRIANSKVRLELQIAYYLELNNKQKKLGWIFIGAGVVFITAAGILSKEIGNYSQGAFISTAGSSLIAGLFCIPMAICTLVISSTNKRKGANFLLRKETVLELQNIRFGLLPFQL